MRHDRLVFALALVPPLVLGLLVHLFFVNIPFIDEWGMYLHPFLNDSLANQDWEVFWAVRNHGVHRKFFPMLIGSFLLKATNFNMEAIVFLVIALHGWMAYLLYRMFNRISGSETSILLPVFTFGLLSLSTWPYWMQPLFLEVTLAIFGLVGAVYFVTTESEWRGFGMAAAMALLGSLSFFAGYLIWIFVPILFKHFGYARARYFFAWFGLGSLVFVQFLTGYLPADHGSRLSAFAFSPLKLVQFILIFLGGPYTAIKAEIFAMVVGFTLLLIFGSFFFINARWVQDGVRRSLPWLTIGLWVLANGVFSAIGRSEEGAIALYNAWVSRYSMYGTLFFTAIIPMVVIFILGLDPEKRQNRIVRRLLSFAWGSVAVLMLLYGAVAVSKLRPEALRASAAVNSRVMACAVSYLVVEDSCFGNTYPNKQTVRDSIARLYSLEIYARPPSDLPAGFAVAPEHLSAARFELPDQEWEVYAQQINTTVLWALFLPRVDSPPLPGSPLDGLWLETGVISNHIGTTFQIRITPTGSENGTTEVVTIEALPLEVNPLVIDLTRYAGGQVLIRFEVLGDPATSAGYWLLPRLVFSAG